MKKLLTLLLSLFMTFSLCMTISAEDGKASIGTTKYTTLADAISAAQDGDIVSLIDDEDVSTSGLTINKNITLDLNGHSLKAANKDPGTIKVLGSLTLKDSTDTDKKGTGAGKIYTETNYTGDATGHNLIEVYNNGNFTMESGLIDAASFTNNNSSYGQFAVGSADPQDSGEAKITINGGHIKAGWYAVDGNGEVIKNSIQITINGGILESTADYAIYLPHNGTTTINGGVVYGAAGGVQINRGKLIINGGIVTSKGVGSTGEWGNGTGGTSNAAVHVNAKFADSETIITGGTIKAEGNAFLITEGQNNYNKKISISGGIFSSDVTKYLVDNTYNAVKNSDGEYVVVKEGSEVKVNDNTPALEEVAYDVVKSSIGSTITFDSSTKVVVETEDIAESSFPAKQKEEATEKVLNEIKTNSDKVDTSTIGLIPLDISLGVYNNGQKAASISKLNDDITVTLYLNETTLNKVKGKKIYVVRFHEEEGPEEKALANAINNKTEVTVLDATLTNNALSFKTNKFSTYVIAYGDYIPTKTYSYKDKNQDGIISCEEEMNNANWIWSESKGACVYKVSNTGTK